MRWMAMWAAAVLLVEGAQSQFSAATSAGGWAPSSRRRTASSESSNYGYSDCTIENSLGLTNGGEIAWFQGVSTADRGLVADAIFHIASATGGQASCVPQMAEGSVYVYDDPGGDDTDPTDLSGADLRASEDWTAVTCTSVKDSVIVSPNGLVSDGFWFAAMLEQPAGEFPAPFDTDTAPSNGHSWVTGSNTAFDPLDPGGGIGFFEMAALGFDSHWVMNASGTGLGVVPYCTAKTGLTCGTPAMSSFGVPTAGASSGFELRAGPARPQKAGLYLYSCDGRAALPFDGGTLCVAAPVRRTVVIDSGGNGNCDGLFRLDWNAFASGNAGGNPHPCVQVVGQNVTVQCWGRDTPGRNFLSNALEFVMH